jgi:hypothetical protein
LFLPPLFDVICAGAGFANQIHDENPKLADAAMVEVVSASS